MKLITYIIIMLVAANIVFGASIIDGDILFFGCNNATSGVLLGTSATITCYDSDTNTDINNQALTNVATGIFRYTFSGLSNDRYSCKIDCPSGAVDYVVPVWLRTTPLITTDNIGINLDNVTGTLDASEIGSGAITADKIASNAITDAKIASGAITATKIATDAITADKIAASAITSSEAPNLDAAVSTRSTHTAANVWAVATRTLTTADWTTDSDLSSLQTHGDSNWATATGFATTTQATNILNNQSTIINRGNSAWTTATGFATSSDATNILNNQSTIINRGNSAWTTAVGFSTHSAADVWAVGTRTLTDYSGVWSVATRTLSNYSGVWSVAVRTLTTADWSTATDITNLQTNIFNGTLSTHTPADIWAVATRTLSDYSGVWSVATRTLSDYSGVWSVATRTLSDYSGVWAVGTRTLSSFGSLVSDIGTQISSEHGTGLYNTTAGAAVISEADKTDIANKTFILFIQNQTKVYTYTSTGMPYIDTITFDESGDILTITWGVNNTAVLNETWVRS